MSGYYLDTSALVKFYYDATHLATAFVAHQFLVAQGYSDLVFISADNRLNHAAVAEGLSVDNPNNYL